MTRAKNIGPKIEKSLKKKLRKKVDLKKLSKKQLKGLADTAIEEIKKSVSKGISPIEGKRRFPAYKNPEVYPDKVRGDFPKKRRRPVNLELSGDFLKNLKSKIQKLRKVSIRIGFFDDESSLKEQGHREGANGQPKRPIIPKPPEEFTRRIHNLLIKEFKAIFKKNIGKKR